MRSGDLAKSMGAVTQEEREWVPYLREKQREISERAPNSALMG